MDFPTAPRRIKENFAVDEGFADDQFHAIVASDKMAALQTVEYLPSKVASGRRENLERFLVAVPTQPPVESDALPDAR